MAETPPFILGAPRGVYLAYLQRERASGDRWTDTAVRVSVMLDLDRGDVKDFTRYGRQWRWNVAQRGLNTGRATDETGRNAVRRAWPGIVADVLDWLTLGRRFWGSPLLDRVPDEWWQIVGFRPPDDRATTAPRPDDDRETGESGSESRADDRATTAPRPDDDRHTRHDSIQITERESPTRASRPVAAGDTRPSGDAYGSPAVAAYHAVTGAWPAPFHAEAIARRFSDADPEQPAGAALLTSWAETVTTYHVSPSRNALNVPGIIQTFDEQLRRTAAQLGAHAGADSGTARGDERASQRTPQADPAPGAADQRVARVHAGAARSGPGAPGRVVGTASQRASVVTIRALLDGADEHDRRRAADADALAAGGRGDDDGYAGGL